MIPLRAPKSCRSCGCPAALHRAECPFCDNPLGTEDLLLTLVRQGAGYRWMAGSETIARVACITGLWEIADADGEVVTTMLPLGGAQGAGSASIALLGPDGALLGTIGGLEGDATLGTVRDGAGGTVLTARPGGPTGIHVADCDGEIAALASWAENGAEGGLDVLVTDRGTQHPSTLLLALLLGVLLVAVGDLDRV